MQVRKLRADCKVAFYRWRLYVHGHLLIGIAIYNYRIKSWIRSLKAKPNTLPKTVDEVRE
jgi:hypothetical protein